MWIVECQCYWRKNEILVELLGEKKRELPEIYYYLFLTHTNLIARQSIRIISFVCTSDLPVPNPAFGDLCIYEKIANHHTEVDNKVAHKNTHSLEMIIMAFDRDNNEKTMEFAHIALHNGTKISTEFFDTHIFYWYYDNHLSMSLFISHFQRNMDVRSHMWLYVTIFKHNHVFYCMCSLAHDNFW